MANSPNENERVDEPTGTEFVGHEWDGIEELDTAMPRWWVWTFYLTIIWGVIYLVLYPAWPMLEKGTEGLLGWTSRGQLAQEMAAADLARQSFRDELNATQLADLPENPELFRKAVAGGWAAFKVNCVQCHGSGAAGSQGLGYPNLADDDWLWGGDLQAIEYTLTHGIRQQGHNESRIGVMPAFEGVWGDQELDAVASHVLSLSGNAPANSVGAELYDVNCASCHGPNGQGDRSVGAPNLSDAIWLHGGSRAQIKRQILSPRMGMMPKWGDRLDPATIKMLAAYVHSLGGGEQLEVAGDDPTVAVATDSDEPS